jgi:hypothetical protein
MSNVSTNRSHAAANCLSFSSSSGEILALPTLNFTVASPFTYSLSAMKRSVFSWMSNGRYPLQYPIPEFFNIDRPLHFYPTVTNEMATHKSFTGCADSAAFLSRAFSSCRIFTSAKATCFPASKVVIQSLLNVLSCDAQADSSCLRCARSRNDKKGGASELWSGH